MVSKFIFELDDIQVSDPKGWEDLDTTIKRDYTIEGLLISQEAQLEFFADGYNLIKQKFDSNGFCDSVKIKIKQTCDQLNYDIIFEGLIFLSECVFDLMRPSVKCKTVDNGFYAKINNNKSIKSIINVAKSKNGIDITAAQDIVVKFFYPSTGVYPTQVARHCYRIFEVLKYLVHFMSDGQVNFISDDFDIGGKWEGVCITKGNEINNADQAKIPEVSFQEVFTELNKKLRIGFAIEYILGVPTLRIEHAEYFYAQGVSVNLPNAKEVTMQMDQTQLYSKVHLGSSITDDQTTPLGTFAEGVRFLGFIDETYQVVGICNVDTTLELESQWVVSSNIIELSFDPTHDATYDDDIFLLHVDLGTPNRCHQSNWIDPSTIHEYYNEIFNNENVAKNWFDGIPNQIAAYLGNGNNKFQASSTSDITLTPDPTLAFPINAQIRFQDDFTTPNNDPNGNYNIVNSRYIIPVSGLYTFIAYGYGGSASGATSNGILSIQKWDSTFTNLLDEYTLDFQPLSAFPFTNFYSGSASIIANATDIIICRFEAAASINVIAKKGFIFSCTSDASGGIFTTNDPANYKIRKYSFKYPLTYNQSKTIKANIKKLISFTTNNNIAVSGWIDSIKYFHHNKDAEISLITNDGTEPNASEPTSFHLREDGGFILREDGGKSVRE